MNEERHYLSKEKFEQLTHELEVLRTDKRKEVAEKLEFAKSLGDLSENAEYQEAREDQAKVEERIMTLEALLQAAEIVSARRGSRGGAVDVGSKVVVRKIGERTDREYQIVGSEEADMAEGKISNKSPIGMALIGSSKGDEVEYSAPNGDIRLKVVDVK